MIGEKAYFSTMRHHVRLIKLANGEHIQSKGEGEVLFQPWVNGSFSREPIVFPNVLFAPDLESNLISVLSLVRNGGYQITINEKQMEFHREGKLQMTARIDSNCVAHLDGRVVTPDIAYAYATSTCPLDRELWHRRFCHIHHQGLEAIIRDELVRDLDIKSNARPDPICTICLAGKQHRAPHTIPASRSDELLHRVAADLHGPVHTEALPFRSQYWMPIVDEASGYVHVVLLRHKHEALEAFKMFKAQAETQTGKRIKHHSRYSRTEWSSRACKPAHK